MTLHERLQDDLKAAMRAKDTVRLDTIRLLRAAITRAEQDRLREALDKERSRRAAAQGIPRNEVEIETDVVAALQSTAKLDDAGVLGIVRQEVKRRREAIEQFRAGHREDLAAKEQAELDLLGAYLPRQLDEAEIEAAAKAKIAAVGAEGPSDLGNVMGPLMKELRDQADGQLVRQVVQRLLAG